MSLLYLLALAGILSSQSTVAVALSFGVKGLPLIVFGFIHVNPPSSVYERESPKEEVVAQTWAITLA